MVNGKFYTKRISDLRQEGHNIQGEREYINGRATGIWRYSLSRREMIPKKLEDYKLHYEPVAETLLNKSMAKYLKKKRERNDRKNRQD